MRVIVPLLAIVIASGCAGEPPAGLFPVVSSTVPAPPFAGTDAVRATLTRASIQYSDFSILETDAGPVVGITVSSEAAEKLWNLDKAVWKSIGATIVFCGEDKCLEEMKSHRAKDRSTTSILDKATSLSLKTWALERYASDARYFRPERKRASKLQPRSQPREAMWTSVLGEPLGTPAVFVLPTTSSWKAPAYLAFGGWNECPDPETQVAFARYLNQTLGAEIVGVRYDSIRYSLAKRPPTEAEAIRLAWESFLYCPDAVHQGSATLEGLAEFLLGSSSIDFWWD
jgi:hypothetical protein